ncbi:PAS domain S-box-containing protein [Cnuella takakiae]|uniref:histidine kinase n=1 Tax=Cnuella takakiae TaxID=1302690 RepID=A0A1M5CS20_9BACT|nr:PAS domain-containing sensor histidine kinase [Cnuella takakiae]OLY91924.1 hypothetical protein BUE76_08460 [Cnuella takakiae]SHF57545.1 PAS domain S-box-containing protein [Cnuella takakiae]
MRFFEPDVQDALALLRSVPGCFLILFPDSPKFTIAGATDAYLQATFTRREAIVGKPLFDVFTDNPNNPQATGVRNLRASLEQVLATRCEHYMVDQRYDVWNEARQTYEVKVWRPYNKPVLDQHDNLRFIYHWVEDVTENALLKESEASATRQAQLSIAELQKSNERFHLLNRATQDAVWDWDLVTNQVWWSEGFKSLFGFKEAEIEPGVESWYNRLHPDERHTIVTSIHSFIDNGGKNWTKEYRFRKADGTYAHVYDRGYALHDQDGKPYRMMGSMIDITEQHRMMNVTLESEARTRMAITSARLGTYEVDMTTQQIMFSERTAEIFGLSPKVQNTYTQFIDAIYPEDAKIRHKAHEQALQTGELFYEVRIVPRAGQLAWVRVNGMITEIGGRRLLIGTVLDITEEKRAAELLEQKIRERTRELTVANEQLQQFTYAASHDLQEPLRKISFFVDRLVSQLDTASETENRRMADRIQHTVNRMRTLINDLLNYSNAAQGTTMAEQVSLSDVVQEVLDDMEAAIIEKKATVQVGALPVICGDQRQLKQLFQNLVSNALKYHREEEAPQVHIRAKQAAESGTFADQPMVEITVSDNGIGFDPEDADRIFGLFQRLHGRAEYEGTGVGLAIVHKVVDNHGGKIWAEGRPGKGASFHLLLPAG